ncbi:MAG: glycosyltransferase [Clostridia bacterium]|nr:glycosyltransferase [Clostridia bacterium]
MITIIVPIFSVERYLRQCIDSILNQTYKDIEILLVDDGSTDQCGEICDDYAKRDNRIRVFHTENQGISAARNLGLRESGGEYIGFVDADDWIEPEMYEIMYSIMQETGADISTCGLRHDSTGIPNRKDGFNITVLGGEEVLEAIVDRKFESFMWNKLFKAGLFEGLTFPEGKVFEDLAATPMIVSKSGKVAVSDAPLYHYRQWAGSITKVRSADNLIDYADACLARHRFIMGSHPDLFERRQEGILRLAAEGVCKVWRWWFGCNKRDRQKHKERITELVRFTRKNVPLFGYRSWPKYLRFSTVFMYSRSGLSFALMYLITQAYRKFSGRDADEETMISPIKAN